MTERALPKLLHELGSRFGAHTPWLFLTKDRKGVLKVFSDQRPEQIRHFAAEYLRTRMEKRAP